MSKQTHDTRPVTTLVATTGNGPAECSIALEKLLAEIEERAEYQDLRCTVTRGPSSSKHGPRSAVIELEGAYSDRFADDWTGTVQWICQSPIRPHHKRRNWFVGLFPLESDPADIPDLAEADLRVERFRAGGPGGQHQNTTDSAVRITHLPTGLAAIARDGRSQHRNRAMALDRLKGMLAARAMLAEQDRQAQTHREHYRLERGNPVRVFKGPRFEEVW